MNIKYDGDGLVPCIVQDVNTGQVLMMAYINDQALQKTENTGYMWFWSRSRGELWQKGETSGNKLQVESLKIDCDGDTILAQVTPNGPACHTGEVSCFFTDMVEKNNQQEQNVKIEDFGENFQRADRNSFSETRNQQEEILQYLEQTLQDRLSERPEGSYTVKLTDKGDNQVLKKVSEESGEFIMACKDEDTQEIVHECADLMFHTLLALVHFQVDLDRVCQELVDRHQK